MGRTSIPCDDETRDELAEMKPELETWDSFLLRLAGEGGIQKNSDGELVDEIQRLRRELDEFKHNMPGRVAEELR